MQGHKCHCCLVLSVCLCVSGIRNPPQIRGKFMRGGKCLEMLRSRLKLSHRTTDRRMYHRTAAALPRWTAKWAVRVRGDFNFWFWAQLAHLIQLGDYESKRLIRKAFIVMAKYVICNICFGGIGFWGKSGKGEGG